MSESKIAEQQSYLYLLTHERLQLHKVGIGTVGKDKGLLRALTEQGWSIQGTWCDSDKRQTFRWERAIYKELEAHIASLDLKEPALTGRRDKHWVEYISASAISLAAITELMERVIRDKK
jgi:hypothetical protein